MIKAEPPSAGADQPALSERASNASAFAQAVRVRIANVWVSLAACAIIGAATMSILGETPPVLWLAGLIPIKLVERALLLRLARACDQRGVVPRYRALIVWVGLQSAYCQILPLFMWFSGYMHGPTLAVIFTVAAIANAIATLRGLGALVIAAAAPPFIAFLAYPLTDFVIGGADNPMDLLPLAGAILFLGFGANLWNSLREDDLARAKVTAALEAERARAAAAARAASEAIEHINDAVRTPLATLNAAAHEAARLPSDARARLQFGALVDAAEVLRVALADAASPTGAPIEVHAVACNPRDLARSVVAAFRGPAHEKGLELFLDIAPNTPECVMLDAPRVRQVLYNLLDNAVRYTNHGGVRVRLQAREGVDRAHVRLGFNVADTGRGMSRSQLALSFEHGRSMGGRRRGLSIAFAIARHLGARLGAKSEIGEGATVAFVLDVPLVAQMQAQRALSAA